MMKPIVEKHRVQMNALAGTIDELFNGKARGKDRKVGFALLVFDFNRIEAGRMNWISNGRREDMIVALKEMIAQLEGRAHGGGNA